MRAFVHVVLTTWTYACLVNKNDSRLIKDVACGVYLSGQNKQKKMQRADWDLNSRPSYLLRACGYADHLAKLGSLTKTWC